MQNRAAEFKLDPDHPNALKPGKSSYQTIMPGFLTKDGQAIGPFGVMGGYMQPQGHFQVAINTIDYKLNPQATLDAPRWQWIKGQHRSRRTRISEPSRPSTDEAGARHRTDSDNGSFGRGQIIWRDPKTGILSGGTESRTDGAIAVW